MVKKQVRGKVIKEYHVHHSSGDEFHFLEKIRNVSFPTKKQHIISGNSSLKKKKARKESIPAPVSSPKLSVQSPVKLPAQQSIQSGSHKIWLILIIAVVIIGFASLALYSPTRQAFFGKAIFADEEKCKSIVSGEQVTLDEDIYFTTPTCFTFSDVQGATLDCRGHTISGPLDRVGGTAVDIDEDSSGITIRNCHFRNMNPSVYIRGSSNTVERSFFENAPIRVDGDENIIQDILFTDAEDGRVKIGPGSINGDRNQIMKNEFTALDGQFIITGNENSIRNNVFKDSRGVALFITSSASSSPSDNIIMHNYISGSAGGGVLLRHATETRLEGNFICVNNNHDLKCINSSVDDADNFIGSRDCGVVSSNGCDMNEFLQDINPDFDMVARQCGANPITGTAITNPSCDADICNNGWCQFCGNRILDTGEQCDDGNFDDGDGCSSLCVVEDGFSCNEEEPSICITDAICGNDVVETGEQCDGGNLNGRTCVTELGNGYTGSLSCNNCQLVTSSCIPPAICGNGVLDQGEVCDDGNRREGDGCSNGCEVENEWRCRYASNLVHSVCFPPEDDDGSETPELIWESNEERSEERIYQSTLHPYGATISFWVKPTSLTGEEILFGWGDEKTGEVFLRLIRKGANLEVKAIVNGREVDLTSYYRVSGQLEENEWNHVGIILKYVGFNTISLNGQQVGAMQSSPPRFVTTQVKFASGSPRSEYKEIRLYRGAMAREELEDIYRGILPTPAVCGNGILETGEVCDIGIPGAASSTGCYQCQTVTGWVCANPNGDNAASVCTSASLDADNDAICDGSQAGADCRAGPDNCPTIYNPDQADADGDGYGDACDSLNHNQGRQLAAGACATEDECRSDHPYFPACRSGQCWQPACESDAQCGVGLTCQNGRCLSADYFCGNRELDPGEQCDLGGTCQGGAACTVDGAPCGDTSRCMVRTIDRGCSSSCSVLPGWKCPDGFSCRRSCGDSVVDPGEQCDDGNSADGDGCYECQEEPGWICPHNLCERPAEVTLTSCTPPGGAWVSGTIYKIDRSIRDVDGTFCPISLGSVTDVVIDCQGNEVKSINLGNVQRATIRNCNVVAGGIRIGEGSNNFVEDNNIVNPEVRHADTSFNAQIRLQDTMFNTIRRNIVRSPAGLEWPLTESTGLNIIDSSNNIIEENQILGGGDLLIKGTSEDNTIQRNIIDSFDRARFLQYYSQYGGLRNQISNNEFVLESNTDVEPVSYLATEFPEGELRNLGNFGILPLPGFSNYCQYYSHCGPVLSGSIHRQCWIFDYCSPSAERVNRCLAWKCGVDPVTGQNCGTCPGGLSCNIDGQCVTGQETQSVQQTTSIPRATIQDVISLVKLLMGDTSGTKPPQNCNTFDDLITLIDNVKQGEAVRCS